MALLEDSGQVWLALTPLRRQLLEALRQPESASELRLSVGLPLQKVNDHLGVLERADGVDRR